MNNFKGYEKTINYYINHCETYLNQLKKIKNDRIEWFNKAKAKSSENQKKDINLELEFYKNSDRERFFGSKIKRLEKELEQIEDHIKDIKIQDDKLNQEIKDNELFLKRLYLIKKDFDTNCEC